jgi:hypothetical protein
VWELTCCTHLGFLLAGFHLHHQAPPCFGGLRLDSKRSKNLMSKFLITKKSYIRHIPNTAMRSCRQHVPYCFLFHSMEYSYNRRSPLEWRLNQPHDTCRANMSVIWLAIHMVKYGSLFIFMAPSWYMHIKLWNPKYSQSIACDMNYHVLNTSQCLTTKPNMPGTGNSY